MLGITSFLSTILLDLFELDAQERDQSFKISELESARVARAFQRCAPDRLSGLIGAMQAQEVRRVIGFLFGHSDLPTVYGLTRIVPVNSKTDPFL